MAVIEIELFFSCSRQKACPQLDWGSSIALATVLFFNEEQLKKKPFIPVISKLKWYAIGLTLGRRIFGINSRRFKVLNRPPI